MPNAISRHFTDELLTRPLTLNDKITLFVDRVNGWQLDIAEQVVAIPHGGFAALSVVTSYFEMIGTYLSGKAEDRGSAKAFATGLRSVLDPHKAGSADHIPDALYKALIAALYVDLRCGLYHAGITGPNILLRIADDMPIVGVEDGRVLLDPRKLVDAVRFHFMQYIQAPMDPHPHNDQLRSNFEQRFDQPASHRRVLKERRKSATKKTGRRSTLHKS
jgi:hypothetical protein